MLRIFISLFIGAVIVGEVPVINHRYKKNTLFSFSSYWWIFLFSFAALNFTNDWAEARMTTNTTYKSFSNVVVNADVGLHVGLYGINITLKGGSRVLTCTQTCFHKKLNILAQYIWTNQIYL